MPLTEDRRRQLDTIVLRMTSNNESRNNIQTVVNDFKSKYGDYGQQTPRKQGAFNTITSGLSRGLTLGASDVASDVVSGLINKFRGGTFKEGYQRGREYTKQQKQERPVLSTASEFAGYVNPAGASSAVLRGGAKALGKVGAKTALKKLSDIGKQKTLKGLGARTLSGLGRNIAETSTLSSAEQLIKDQKIDQDRLKTDIAGTLIFGGAGKGAKQIGKWGVNTVKVFTPKHLYKSGDKLSKKIIESNVLRGAKTTDKLERGFENFKKHDLWGNSFEEILDKANKKIDKSTSSLNEAITKSRNTINTNDLKKVYDKTYENLINDTQLNNQYGYKKVKTLLDQIKNDMLETAKRSTQDGVLPNADVVNIKRAVDNNVNYNVKPDDKVLLRSAVYHEYRKHLDDLLGKRIGKKYKEANKALNELLPVQRRVDYNYNRQRQLLEPDNETFSRATLLKRIFYGDSPKRDLGIANKVRGKDPTLLQLKNLASEARRKAKPIQDKTIAPRVGRYGGFRTLSEIFN